MNLLAVDVGFTATGYAVMVKQGEAWRCRERNTITTKPDDKKATLRKAESDIQRVQQLAVGLDQVINIYEIKRMVVELPHGGAKSSRAVRCMALASAMVATLAHARGLAVEYYTPNETRYAAVGRTDKVTKADVIAAMERLHDCAGLTEHEADALATFEAARQGNLCRL